MFRGFIKGWVRYWANCLAVTVGRYRQAGLTIWRNVLLNEHLVQIDLPAYEKNCPPVELLVTPLYSMHVHVLVCYNLDQVDYF